METKLPVEIIEMILSLEDLSISDVFNYSLTNRYNHHLVTKNAIIWKKKYLQTWPQLRNIIDSNDYNFDWYGEVQYIYGLKRRTREILSTMSPRFFKQKHLSDSDLTEWLEMYHEKPQTYYYLTDDLMDIVNTQATIESKGVIPITTPGNKTLQYYAMQVLRYLRHLHLAKEWGAFVALSPEQQILEKVFAFAVEWCQPNVNLSWEIIGAKLDEFTEQVKEHLKTINPNHPLFQVTTQKLRMWRDGNLDSTSKEYGEVHYKQIITAVTNAMFLRPEGYILEEWFLDKSKCSCHGVVQTIIFDSVTRRLGVIANDEENDQDFISTKAQDTIIHIAKNIEIPGCSPRKRYRSLLELKHLVQPFNVAAKTRLAKFYMTQNMDTTSYIESLKQQINQAPERINRIINTLQRYEAKRNHHKSFMEIQRGIRPPNLKYAVGMVMKDVWHLGVISVICDWVPVCSLYDMKPAYRVLFEDGSHDIISQEHLRPSDNSGSLHLLEDIGKYFSHMCGTHFVPNMEKDKEYPADAEVRAYVYEPKISLDGLNL